MIGSESPRALISVDRYSHGLSNSLAEACISMMVWRDDRV